MIWLFVKEAFREFRIRQQDKASAKRIHEILNQFEDMMEETKIVLSTIRRENYIKEDPNFKNIRMKEQCRLLMSSRPSRSLLNKQVTPDVVPEPLKAHKKPTKVTTLDKNSVVFLSSRPDVLSFLSTSPLFRKDEYNIILEKPDFNKRYFRHVSNYVDLRTYDMNIFNHVGKVGVRRVNVTLESSLGSKAFSNNVFKYKDSDLTEETKSKYFRYLIKVEDDENSKDNNKDNYILDFDNPTILNVNLYGANAVGTLVALAPWNICSEEFFKEKANELGIMSIDNNDKIIQLPVSKEQHYRDNISRTADSARFIYAHNPFFNNIYTNNPKNIVDDVRYWESGRHLRGSSYWYKDKDGLPSVIRPMYFNNFITILSRYGYNFRARMPLDGGMISGTHNREEDIPSRIFSNPGFISNAPHHRATKEDLYLTTDILDQLNESLKNKIVVTDFKRVNLTFADIDRTNYRCPILESYLEDGYSVISNESESEDQILKEIFEDMLSRVRLKSPDLYNGAKTEKEILKDAIDRATGKVIMEENVEGYFKSKLSESADGSSAYDILSNLKVEEGGFKTPSSMPVDRYGNSNYVTSTHYEDQGFCCRDIVVKTNPTLAPDILCGTSDFIETDKGYTIGKNEILIRSQLPSGPMVLSVTKSFSVCLVKHTIIDTKDFESSSEDVLYDTNSELLIGKIYRNIDKTKECISKYQHPLSKGYHDKQVGGYNFKYIRNVDDSSPRDIYVNVLGIVEHVVAEDTIGYETSVEVYKDGKRIKAIPKVNFEREGIFYSRPLAASFSKYDTKLQYNHNLNELGKSELATYDLETKRSIAERNAIDAKVKHDLEMLRVEAELDKLAKSKDLEEEKFKNNLAKARLDLEKIHLSIEELEKEKIQLLTKIEHDIRLENTSKPVTSQLLDFANLIGKSAAAGTAMTNLYRLLKTMS